MRKYLVSCLTIFTFILSATLATRAAAQQTGQTVAEKLLIILKENHHLSQRQYDELLQEAQQEKAARKAAVAKQVKAWRIKAAKEYKKKHPLSVHGYWKKGALHFKSNDGNFTMHIGGYAQVDFGGASINDRMKAAFPTGLQGYGTELRNARLLIEGTMYRDFDYRVKFNFAGGKAAVKDMYVSYYGFPCFANIRVGHMKMPFSLEELTGLTASTFTERSLNTAFEVPNKFSAFDTGIQLFNTEFGKRMTWAVGGFMQASSSSSGNVFNAGSFNNVNTAVRLTCLPWYADNGCELLHLGFSYLHLFRSDNTANWSSSLPDVEDYNKPEWHLSAVKTINTPDLVAQGVDEIDPEAALVYGPFSVQGEYFESFLHNYTTNDVTFTNPSFNGYYVMASWFLTGEHRPYNRNKGVFVKPAPFHNFDPAAGTWGAWEVALRYSDINLNDENVKGGTEQDWTAGLNWYLNRNVKMMFDYVHAHVDDEVVGKTFLQNGDANIFDTRLQVVF